jgi:hypothetical protein
LKIQTPIFKIHDKSNKSCKTYLFLSCVDIYVEHKNSQKKIIKNSKQLEKYDKIRKNHKVLNVSKVSEPQ